MTAANDNVASPGPDVAPVPRPCPICARPASSEFKPFCSKRCADVDLHRWLAGGYALPSAPDVDDLPDSGDPT